MNKRASREAEDVVSGSNALASDIQLQNLRTDLDALVARAALVEAQIKAERDAHPGEENHDLDKAEREAGAMRALAESVRQEVDFAKTARGGKKLISAQRVSELTVKIERELHAIEPHVALALNEKHETSRAPARHAAASSHVPARVEVHPVKRIAAHTVKAAPAVAVAVNPLGKFAHLHVPQIDLFPQVQRVTHAVGHGVDNLWHSTQTVAGEVSDFAHALPGYASKAVDGARHTLHEMHETCITKPIAKAKAVAKTYVVEPVKSGLRWVSAAPGRLWHWATGDDAEEAAAKAKKAKEEAAAKATPKHSPSMLDSLAKAASVALPVNLMFHEVGEIRSVSAQVLPYAHTLFSSLHLSD